MNILKLQNDIFKILIEIFIFNKTERMKIKSRWAKWHLNKYVNIAIKHIEEVHHSNLSQSEKETSNIIWQYWHQGKDNAPLLIRKCLESIKKYHSDKEIVVLDYGSIKNYIEIPQKYYDMVNQDKMRLAFFSDILRTYLLSKYGGTWIDSTIFLTGKIPEDIFRSDFFVLSKNPEEDWLENRMSNFFIHSNGASNTIECLKNALDEYWNENDFVINYFMYEHIATMLSKIHPCKEEWDKMPYYSAEETGLLQKIMFDDYNSETLERIKQKTNLHKLSYKILKEETSGISYYDKIISGEII